VIAGRYSLLREIGRGGMGAVWLARDEVLGREVAVKRLGMFPGGGSSPDLVRAEREAKLAARLNHPHVVAVYDFVGDGDSQWLVMEYVEGKTLSELAGNGGLHPDDVARVVRQAAEALAAAHEAGIVHRDVKPSNILVMPDGTAKLTDFGIARARADSTLTRTGMLTGSPAYLAPEVAAGGTATDASDVWSLGATTFHALSGRPPYDVTDNLVGALYRIVHEDPPRLADAGELGPLLSSTMTKDPERRWSMAQVRDFLDGREVPPVVQVEQPLVIAPNPLAPPPRRRPLLPWVVGTLVAVVVVAVGAWLLLRDGDDGSPPARSTPTSSAPVETPPETAATAAGMTAFVETYLDTVADDPAAAWDMLTPAFQQESGGFASYDEFWSPVRRIAVNDVAADPESLTVTYSVRYIPRPSGGPRTDQPTLQLEFDGESYLITGES